MRDLGFFTQENRQALKSDVSLPKKVMTPFCSREILWVGDNFEQSLLLFLYLLLIQARFLKKYFQVYKQAVGKS